MFATQNYWEMSYRNLVSVAFELYTIQWTKRGRHRALMKVMTIHAMLKKILKV